MSIRYLLSIILGITGTLAEGYWTSPLYLYNNGTWSNLQTTGATVVDGVNDYTDNGIYLYIRTYASSTTIGFVRLNQTINISNYNYIKSSIGTKSGESSYKAGIGISTSATASALSSLKSYIMIETDSSNYKTAILNISSITGSYYIYLLVNSGSMNPFYFRTLFLSTT